MFKGQADWRGADQDLEWATRDKHHILSYRNSLYPPLLKETHRAPMVLFVKGAASTLSMPQIAVVGTRNPTPAGAETALQFARHFANMGFGITSGLAIGIDGAAHRGALEEAGVTLGVLGNGLDKLYPSIHQSLALSILESGGALVSEFPVGTPPLPAHFPRRNRVISGLSIGVLVVEATLNSGSLITAKYALEQGREVFAIPGSIHNAMVKGCHSLIQQGAKLVQTAQDVLEELGALTKYVILPHGGQQAPQPTALDLSEPETVVLSYLGYEATPVDLIVIKSGLTAIEVANALLSLELKGYLAPVPGGYARILASAKY